MDREIGELMFLTMFVFRELTISQPVGVTDLIAITGEINTILSNKLNLTVQEKTYERIEIFIWQGINFGVQHCLRFYLNKTIVLL